MGQAASIDDAIRAAYISEGVIRPSDPWPHRDDCSSAADELRRHYARRRFALIDWRRLHPLEHDL